MGSDALSWKVLQPNWWKSHLLHIVERLEVVPYD